MPKILSIITILVSTLYLNYVGFAGHRNLQIHFLDVGQGDAILIKTPDNKYMLIDGGPSSNLLEELSEVMPFWERRIDLLVATHGDADHITGLVDVAERYEVQKFIHNGKSKDTLTYKQLINNLILNKVEITAVTDSDDFVYGCCVNIDLIWPKEDQSSLTDNDLSVSFIMDYGDFEVYLAGDLSKEYEEEAVESLDYDIEIYKAGHHGSRTSTSDTLVDNLKPELAVVTVGKENRFNHPHKEVLDIFEAQGLQVFRTDMHGRVSFESDGKKFWKI